MPSTLGPKLAFHVGSIVDNESDEIVDDEKDRRFIVFGGTSGRVYLKREEEARIKSYVKTFT
ncbi:MAG: hypothetical protein NVSMB27_20770 [Ktedonobacteraceae bacterium]